MRLFLDCCGWSSCCHQSWGGVGWRGLTSRKTCCWLCSCGCSDLGSKMSCWDTLHNGYYQACMLCVLSSKATNGSAVRVIPLELGLSCSCLRGERRAEKRRSRRNRSEVLAVVVCGAIALFLTSNLFGVFIVERGGRRSLVS